MSVRRAGPGDADAIAEVHVRTWQVAYEHVFGHENLARLEVGRRAARWREVLDDGDVAFVALERDRVVGFASVGPNRDEPDEGEVYAVYVLPQAWGTGAGSALLAAGVQALREAGFREAILWVLEDNPRARRFYEREGWRADGTAKEDEHLGVRVAEVRYRLALAV